MMTPLQYLRQVSLIMQIIIGLICGTLLALVAPSFAASMGVLGSFFVSCLKAVAPILVFFLVCSAIATKDVTVKRSKKFPLIIFLYVVGTFAAALVAVVASFLFPTTVQLVQTGQTLSSPGGIWEVLRNLVFSMVDNPFNALVKGNYIGILAWAIALGFFLRETNESTRKMISDFSDALVRIVRLVIHFAPFGIFGLVANTLATEGFGAMVAYGRLLCVLVGSMLVIALVINPLIVVICTKENPYPLTFQVLKESGITAFFTRSSAANIPVNLALCQKLKLDPNIYSVSIPLGATVNMAGAAITITVLAMSAAYTLGIKLDLYSAILLCFLASFGACGAAGVPGGSLMLIPLACSLFGIPDASAMQMVAVGFIIGAVQDSCETALNSSSDVLFTAAVCRAKFHRRSTKK